ncbi:hypothetical protein BESB_003580 [Besnoitia besnoiti]|uniref:Uncharacterized protein n=1 Tax=Besnoitia besnoiti TaxID=94643 RepID=A0A2A9MPM5_BESBE|nr:hypothetical protein BESB_003580 [Besnoitia besnoiti]PFH38017.1 hypothetical protein BESB_003580 [Besnoitia besnoiti]
MAADRVPPVAGWGSRPSPARQRASGAGRDSAESGAAQEAVRRCRDAQGRQAELSSTPTPDQSPPKTREASGAEGGGGASWVGASDPRGRGPGAPAFSLVGRCVASTPCPASSASSASSTGSPALSCFARDALLASSARVASGEGAHVVIPFSLEFLRALERASPADACAWLRGGLARPQEGDRCPEDLAGRAWAPAQLAPNLTSSAPVEVPPLERPGDTPDDSAGEREPQGGGGSWKSADASEGRATRGNAATYDDDDEANASGDALNRQGADAQRSVAPFVSRTASAAPSQKAVEAFAAAVRATQRASRGSRGACVLLLLPQRHEALARPGRAASTCVAAASKTEGETARGAAEGGGRDEEGEEEVAGLRAGPGARRSSTPSVDPPEARPSAGAVPGTRDAGGGGAREEVPPAADCAGGAEAESAAACGRVPNAALRRALLAALAGRASLRPRTESRAALHASGAERTRGTLESCDAGGEPPRERSRGGHDEEAEGRGGVSQNAGNARRPAGVASYAVCGRKGKNSSLEQRHVSEKEYPKLDGSAGGARCGASPGGGAPTCEASGGGRAMLRGDSEASTCPGELGPPAVGRGAADGDEFVSRVIYGLERVVLVIPVRRNSLPPSSWNLPLRGISKSLRRRRGVSGDSAPQAFFENFLRPHVAPEFNLGDEVEETLLLLRLWMQRRDDGAPKDSDCADPREGGREGRENLVVPAGIRRGGRGLNAAASAAGELADAQANRSHREGPQHGDTREDNVEKEKPAPRAECEQRRPRDPGVRVALLLLPSSDALGPSQALAWRDDEVQAAANWLSRCLSPLDTHAIRVFPSPAVSDSPSFPTAPSSPSASASRPGLSLSTPSLSLSPGSSSGLVDDPAAPLRERFLVSRANASAGLVEPHQGRGEGLSEKHSPGDGPAGVGSASRADFVELSAQEPLSEKARYLEAAPPIQGLREGTLTYERAAALMVSLAERPPSGGHSQSALASALRRTSLYRLWEARERAKRLHPVDRFSRQAGVAALRRRLTECGRGAGPVTSRAGTQSPSDRILSGPATGEGRRGGTVSASCMQDEGVCGAAAYHAGHGGAAICEASRGRAEACRESSAEPLWARALSCGSPGSPPERAPRCPPFLRPRRPKRKRRNCSPVTHGRWPCVVCFSSEKQKKAFEKNGADLLQSSSGRTSTNAKWLPCMRTSWRASAGRPGLRGGRVRNGAWTRSYREKLAKRASQKKAKDTTRETPVTVQVHAKTRDSRGKPTTRRKGNVGSGRKGARGKRRAAGQRPRLPTAVGKQRERVWLAQEFLRSLRARTASEGQQGAAKAARGDERPFSGARRNEDIERLLRLYAKRNLGSRESVERQDRLLTARFGPCRENPVRTLQRLVQWRRILHNVVRRYGYHTVWRASDARDKDVFVALETLGEAGARRRFTLSWRVVRLAASSPTLAASGGRSSSVAHSAVPSPRVGVPAGKSPLDGLSSIEDGACFWPSALPVGNQRRDSSSPPLLSPRAAEWRCRTRRSVGAGAVNQAKWRGSLFEEPRQDATWLPCSAVDAHGEAEARLSRSEGAPLPSLGGLQRVEDGSLSLTQTPLFSGVLSSWMASCMQMQVTNSLWLLVALKQVDLLLSPLTSLATFAAVLYAATEPIWLRKAVRGFFALRRRGMTVSLAGQRSALHRRDLTQARNDGHAAERSAARATDGEVWDAPASGDAHARSSGDMLSPKTRRKRDELKRKRERLYLETQRQDEATRSLEDRGGEFSGELHLLRLLQTRASPRLDAILSSLSKKRHTFLYLQAKCGVDVPVPLARRAGGAWVEACMQLAACDIRDSGGSAPGSPRANEGHDGLRESVMEHYRANEGTAQLPARRCKDSHAFGLEGVSSSQPGADTEASESSPTSTGERALWGLSAPMGQHETSGREGKGVEPQMGAEQSGEADAAEAGASTHAPSDRQRHPGVLPSAVLNRREAIVRALRERGDGGNSSIVVELMRGILEHTLKVLEQVSRLKNCARDDVPPGVVEKAAAAAELLSTILLR